MNVVKLNEEITNTTKVHYSLHVYVSQTKVNDIEFDILMKFPFK